MQFTFYPTQNATIYESYPTINTGGDQILELIKTVELTNYNSRILIKFNDIDIRNILTDKQITDARFFLELSVCNYKNLNNVYELYIAPISGSWTGGYGKFLWTPYNTENVTWYNRDTGIPWATGSYSPNTTGSYSTVAGGGTWYSNLIVSKSYGDDIDINIDVTDIVNAWLSNSIDNNGFIIKRANGIELDSTNQGSLQFYSSHTHTIYSPRLIVKWSDHIYSTSSIDILEYNISGSKITTVPGDLPILSYTFLDDLNYDEIIVTSGSILTTSASFTTISSSLQNIPGYGTTGSLFTYNTYGSFSGNIISYISGSFSALINSASISGYFPNATPSYYPTLTNVHGFELSGDSIGYVSGSLSGSFSDAIFSGSYIGNINLISYSGKYETQSLSVAAPETITTYIYSSSQEVDVLGIKKLTPISTVEGYLICISDLQGTYKYDSTPELKFFVRERYPQYTHTTQSQYLIRNKCLPSTSYYYVKDVKTGDIIIEKSVYTLINCSYINGSYINLCMNNFSPERYYNLFVCIESGSAVSITDPIMFKVVD